MWYTIMTNMNITKTSQQPGCTGFVAGHFALVSKSRQENVIFSNDCLPMYERTRFNFSCASCYSGTQQTKVNISCQCFPYITPLRTSQRCVTRKRDHFILI